MCFDYARTHDVARRTVRLPAHAPIDTRANTTHCARMILSQILPSSHADFTSTIAVYAATDVIPFFVSFHLGKLLLGTACRFAILILSIDPTNWKHQVKENIAQLSCSSLKEFCSSSTGVCTICLKSDRSCKEFPYPCKKT